MTAKKLALGYHALIEANPTPGKSADLISAPQVDAQNAWTTSRVREAAGREQRARLKDLQIELPPIKTDLTLIKWLLGLLLGGVVVLLLKAFSPF
ncbi:MAG TPA: DUF1640 domain-containing protein [Methylomirabilota bacterium]|jgi:hypothetical protein|nr:DUF1640 domain-containing protein [Methylomirabilota bacterium]